MTAATLITLRETLEASLVVGIVLTYLHAIQQQDRSMWVWLGVVAGCVMSGLLALVFTLTIGGFSGRAEEIYEGVLLLAAAGLITWMIVWMIQQKKVMRRNIEEKVDQHIKQNCMVGIFFLVFFSVLREGVETVIFLHAAYLQTSGLGQHFVGALAGIAIAIVVAYLFFRGMGRVSMQWCFRVTTVVLLLFAAGLVAHAIHELQEAALLPIFIEHVWDINPVVVTEGVYPMLHEKGAIGGIFKGVFGYNGNPSLLEVIGYVVYLIGIGMVWQRMRKTN